MWTMPSLMDIFLNEEYRSDLCKHGDDFRTASTRVLEISEP